MIVSWSVMGHPARQRAAETLAWMLGGDLALDDAGDGENATGDRAWTLADPYARWHVVVQDDALPVAEIHTQVPAALAAAPSPVVSLYLGTSYPPQTVAPCRAAIERADATRSAWITAPRLFWGVAVAIRAELVADMLRTVARYKTLPYDERISRWCERAGHQVAYTWPSLVDHADGPSLIDGRPRSKPRRAYRVGRPTNYWATDPVLM